MVAVRRLNAEGVQEFRRWLQAGAPGEIPGDILSSPLKSEPVSGEVQVERRAFATRYELGRYLNERLKPLSFSSIAFDAGLWDWLTLFWFDQIAPPDASGKRNLREIARYSQDSGGRRWSRHVVRMCWLSVHNHGDNARYFLSTRLDRHTDLLEQIAGQQEIFGSRAAVALGARLYWDDAIGALKRGAGGKSAGSPRRLARFMKQIRMTYDPELMETDQLLKLLPPEFDRWKEPTAPTAAPSKSARRKSARSLLSRVFGRGGTEPTGPTPT